MFNFKKSFIILVLCAILVIIGGCSRSPQIPKSDSVENFSKYEAIIRNISNKHNFAMTEMERPVYSDGYDATHVSKDLSLLSSKDTRIDIFLSNDALYNEQEGEETFLISYTIPVNKSFDIDLYVELVNAVSGRTISTEYCEDFLNNLKVNNKESRAKKEAFSKSKPLNWESDWVISYTLRDTGLSNRYLRDQELKFSGLTSAKVKN